MKKNIIAILIIIFLFVIVFGYIMFQDRVKIDDYISDEQPLIDGTLMFDYAPFEMDKIAFIEPMGSMIGGHVTPIDHQYYLALDHLLMEEAEIVVDVISPANGTISSIQHMSSLPGENGIEIDDYRLII